MDLSLSLAVERFLDHCRIAKRLSPNTLRAYETDLADFLALAGGGTPAAAVDRDTLRRFARMLFDQRGLKESSVKRRMAALKVMFRWLERDEAIALTPFHRLDLAIRLPRRLPRSLSIDEMRRLLHTAADETRRADRAGLHDALLHHFVVVFLFATGVRVGELAAVHLADLDPIQATILIRGKGNRERRVFLPGQEAAQVLHTYLASRARLPGALPHLLLSAQSTPLSPQHIRRRLAALATRATLPRRVTPHMLRHTAATQLIEAGVDIRFVQKLLGHASIATTQIYTQVSDTSLKATLERANTVGRVGGGG